MNVEGFCTRCGAARAGDAKFCTACGAPMSGAAARAASPVGISLPAVALGALLLAAGGTSAYFAMRTTGEAPRAVPGVPNAAGGGAAHAPEGGLPSGHPSIELPKEVLGFLDGLTAEAEKSPQSVEAAQRLTRARYRASVINAAYRVSAEQALQKLLALDPSNVEGLRISANLAYDAGDFDEATRRFEAFLARHPDDVSAVTDLGSALLFQDRIDDAVAKYRAAIAMDPKFLQAHFNLGIALQKQGKRDDAIASLKQALNLAGAPDERQQVENALAEVEGRQPMQIAGAGERAAVPGGAGGQASAGSSAPPQAAGAGAGVAAANPPAGAAAGSMQGGMPMPPPAPDREVATNASSTFQREAEKPLITHPIVGPRVVAFEWTGPAAARVKVADFPMDKMPPFARAKFQSSMAEKIAAVAARNGVAGPVRIEVVDNASGKVMDTLQSGAAAAARQP